MDLRKLKDQAANATEKRSYAKAAELYLQIADAEPADPDWRQRAGEALRKDGDTAGAMAQYQRAAGAYARAGFLLKAIAACKVVLQLEPGHTATQKLLIDLYGQRDARSVPPLPAQKLMSSDPGRLEVVSLDSRREPSPPPPPPPRLDPDPIFPVGLELAALDEISLENRTLPAGAPLAVVPLATVFSSARSGQFQLVMPDEVTPEIAADASAYEIALDTFWAPKRAPDSVVTPEPEDPGPLDRIDDQVSLSGLFKDATTEPGFQLPPLPKIPLLSSLAPDRLRRLIERSQMRDLAPNEVALRQGDRGGALFVIVSGAVQVMAGEREVARLGEGEFFGEQAILTDQPRTATVAALEPTQLLELSRELVSELVADSPEVLRSLLNFFRDRLLERLLRTSALFNSLSPEDAKELSERFVFLELEPKMRVVREGEKAPGLFLLLAGEVQVLKGLARLATLGPGDVFGEMSLLGGTSAIASIVTVSKCWALELAAKQFQEIMLSYPQVLAYVSELADKRAAANERIELL